VEVTNDITIVREYEFVESFSELYGSISKSEENGVVAVCSFSITKERLKEIKFSPAYLPDIEVMVSSKDLPILKDSVDFLSDFGGAHAVTVKGSTFEENVEKIKELNY